MRWRLRHDRLVSSRPEALPKNAHATATMRANRGRDTALEIRIRSSLHCAGLRFRKNVRLDLSQGRVRPDIVFSGQRLAVFVDGCFWHGCPEHAEWPASNANFWRDKIEATQARDVRQVSWLESDGWRVIRIWEHEPHHEAVERVMTALRSR